MRTAVRVTIIAAAVAISIALLIRYGDQPAYKHCYLEGSRETCR